VQGILKPRRAKGNFNTLVEPRVSSVLSDKVLMPASGCKAVIFFGSDGTGKSTQAILLKGELEKSGTRVKRIWIRGRHTLAFIVSQILLSLGFRSFLPFRAAPRGKILDTRSIPGKEVWSLIEFLSVLPLIFSRVYIPLARGYMLVAERYVIDTIVYNKFFIGEAFNPYSRILLKMIPKGSLLVHLDASRKDVLSRRSDEIFSLDFIDYQLREYRRMSSKLGALTINTSEESIDSANRRILERLEQIETH
jgi:thymidylate kinase